MHKNAPAKSINVNLFVERVTLIANLVEFGKFGPVQPSLASGIVNGSGRSQGQTIGLCPRHEKQHAECKRHKFHSKVHG